MVKVLFVCLGNICRSTMAEFILKDKVNKRGLQDTFYIESAGTSSCEVGSDTHRGTKQELFKRGVPISPRRARQVLKTDYDNFDYILYMDESNRRDLLYIVGQDKDKKIHKVLSFAGSHADVADPWYTGNFAETYEDLNKALDGFLEHLHV